MAIDFKLQQLFREPIEQRILTVRDPIATRNAKS